MGVTFGKLGALAAAAVYAVCVLGSAGDRVSAETPLAARLVPAPFKAEAERREAAMAIAGGKRQLAVAKARDAILADPMNYHAAALLGTSYLLANRPADADRSFRVAALFGWRDQMTQLYWLQASLDVGDYVRGAERLDALLRVNPDFPGRTVAIDRFEQADRGRQALASELAGNPAWSGVLLADVRSLPDAALDRRIDTLLRARKLGAKIACDAVGNYAGQLVQRGRPADARRVWAQYCGGSTDGSVVADPGFAAFLGGKDRGPFGWSALPNGDVSLSASSAPGGKRLLVGENTAPSARAVLIQPLELEPGTYRLSVDGPGAASAALALDCGTPQRPEFNSKGTATATIACPNPVLTLWLAPDSHEVAVRGVSLARAAAQ